MRKRLHHLLLLLPCLLAWAACTPTPKNAVKANSQPRIYPDYTGVTIPAGIAPLNFSMADDSVTAVYVEMKGEKGGHLVAAGSYADFDTDEWHAIVEQNKGARLTLTVSAEKGGQWVEYQPFAIYVSKHRLDAWGLTYRRIAPGYEIYSHMGLYQRNLSTFDEQPIIENTQVAGMCVNCHTANRTNPDQYVYHIRGQHGATFVHHGQADDYLQAKNEVLGGSMVYPYWHPSGRYCAFSTNSTSQMFHTAKKNRIEVYDSKSDVFVYDVEHQTLLNDSLTMRQDWAENSPAFSPDGRWLYYITARQQAYPNGYDHERYDLCRVAFDAETGRLGDTVDTLLRVSDKEKSLTWPRPSYDGRYLMYTLADYGYFTVWHPEADLWLLDLATLETRPMDEVNSQRAESFHNWSGDSRWFLFTSRRDDGLYTRIYLSCVDDSGKATKPFLLPQRDPKTYYRELLYSYNTPDFASRPVRFDRRQAGIDIESDKRVSPTTKKMR